MKIEREAVPHELNNERAQEIIREVFQRKGIASPYSIDFRPKQSAESKSRVYREENTLHIAASTESELKRLIGRFVIRCTSNSHDWLLLNHPGLYILVSLVLLITLPAISYRLAVTFLDYRLWIVILTLVFVVVFSVLAANQVSRRSFRLLRSLTIEMADLKCMTEYDSKDYRGDPHLATIGGTIICVFGAMACILLSAAFYSQENLFILPPVIVLLLAAMYFLLTPAWMAIGSDLCYQLDEVDSQEDEIEDDKFEDNQYLQNAFESLIERMDLRRAISSKNGEEFNQIRARFSETRYAQCRGVYDYVEEGTLFIDIEDISLDAARRYGTAALTRVSIPFYTELSLKRRAIQFIAFFFGLIMMIVALIGGFVVSREFGVGALLFTGIAFTWMWHIGWKQNEQARRDLLRALRRTEVFKEYEVGLYSDMMFSMSARFDLSLLIGFLASFLTMGILVVVLL